LLFPWQVEHRQSDIFASLVLMMICKASQLSQLNISGQQNLLQMYFQPHSGVAQFEVSFFSKTKSQ
jgi:hypothetical protein